MQHTKDCSEKQARAVEAQRAWTARWPNYCRKCGGQGMFHSPGVWRYPDGSGEPPSDEPCPECTEEGRCARCWQEGLDPDTAEGPCKACGWNYDDACPEPWDCWGDCIAHCRCCCALIEVGELCAACAKGRDPFFSSRFTPPRAGEME